MGCTTSRERITKKSLKSLLEQYTKDVNVEKLSLNSSTVNEDDEGIKNL